ncbi:MAG: LEA type 2 family protein [Bacteroidetes bacterium]|nr:LEA type 2 family protein [Bacteroidota bacterium]
MKKCFFLFCLPVIFSSCGEFKELSIGGIEKPKLHKLSREGIDAEFGMKIKNPNRMNVVVYPSEFDGTLNGISIGKIKLYRKVRIKGNSDETEIFNVKSDFSKMGFGDIANVLPIISSGNATLTLKGTLRAGKWYYKKKFPVEYSKAINLKQ